jgi:hypothetical protein
MLTTERRRRDTSPSAARVEDPYLVEPALTLAEWRRRRDEPVVEIACPHHATWLN